MTLPSSSSTFRSEDSEDLHLFARPGRRVGRRVPSGPRVSRRLAWPWTGVDGGPHYMPRW